MISDRTGGESKTRLLGRRMFIISAAKTVVVLVKRKFTHSLFQKVITSSKNISS